MDSVDWDAPSTKRAAEYLRQAADVLDARPLTVVLEDPDSAVGRSFRNLPGVTIMSPAEFATVDAMQARCLLVERAVWERLTGGEGSVETVEGKKKRKPRRTAPPEPKDVVEESDEEPSVEAEEEPEEAEADDTETDEVEASVEDTEADDSVEADVAEEPEADADDAESSEDEGDAVEADETEEDKS
jgi:hypothetical protein